MGMGQRIRAARKASGLSQNQVASALSVKQANVSHWENDTTKPRHATLQKLAGLLKTTPAYLAFGQNDATIPLHAEAALPETSIIGRVEAGAWRDGVLSETAGKKIKFAPHPAFPIGNQKAFEVSGSSCNRVVQSGGYAIVVDYASFPGGIEALVMRPKPPLVIVERERAGAYEYTMKELHAREGRYVLMPASDDPAHQDEIVIDPSGDTNSARIAFVVVQVVNQTI